MLELAILLGVCLAFVAVVAVRRGDKIQQLAEHAETLEGWAQEHPGTIPGEAREMIADLYRSASKGTTVATREPL